MILFTLRLINSSHSHLFKLTKSWKLVSKLVSELASYLRNDGRRTESKKEVKLPLVWVVGLISAHGLQERKLLAKACVISFLLFHLSLVYSIVSIEKTELTQNENHSKMMRVCLKVCASKARFFAI